MNERVLVWLLFEQDGAFLLARRKPGEAPLAGTWTLPGDVMRVDESALETVQRFATAELDVSVAAEEFVDTFYMQEDGIRYAVSVFKPVAAAGRPRYRQSGPYAEAGWFRLADLPSPAPALLVEMLSGKRHWQQEPPALHSDQDEETTNAAPDR